MASQYFLLDKQFKIAFMYDCHTGGEMFKPIGIPWYNYDMLCEGAKREMLVQGDMLLLLTLFLIILCFCF